MSSSWKALGSTVLSNDGQWFGYRLAPQEGDAEIVVKAVRADKTMRFPIGEVPAGGGGGGRGGAAGGATSALAFSDDGKWAAFTTYPTRAAALRLKRQRRPIQSTVTVVNLASGEKKEYPKIRRFAFSGESAGWIALQRYGPDAPGGGGRRRPARPARADAARRGAGAGGARRTAARHRPDSPRPGARDRAQRRQRERLLVPQGRQAARARDRRAGQGGQRPAAPRHDDRRRLRARQRQRLVRAHHLERQRGRARGLEGDRGSRVSRQALLRRRRQRTPGASRRR